MGFFSSIFGKRPTVPTIPTLESAQTRAIQSSVAALPQLQQIGESVNMFNQEQLEKLMEKSFPGAREKVQGKISEMLAGEIPQDVLRNLRRSAAERGVSAGTAGGGFQLGRELSSQLGLSLQMTQQGLDAASRWLAASTAAPSFDVTSMFLSPKMQREADIQQFEREFTAAKVAAAPSPVASGLFNTAVTLTAAALGGASGALTGRVSGLMTPTAAPSGTINMGSSMRAPMTGLPNFYGR